VRADVARRRGHHARPEYDECNETFLFGVADGEHGTGTDRRVSQQNRFDFAELYTKTAQLQLPVAPAHVVDRPVRQHARQIAGTVQTLAATAERIGHETFSRERRLTMVPVRQPDSGADV
jgi:hypothetical protein